VCGYTTIFAKDEPPEMMTNNKMERTESDLTPFLCLDDHSL